MVRSLAAPVGLGILCAMSAVGSAAPLTIENEAGDLTAVIHPAAGMLLSSLRHRGDELLGQRRGIAAYLEHGKTMGIPLLYPWANRLGEDTFTVPGTGVQLDLEGARAGLRRDPNGLPMHGVLAAERGWSWTPIDGFRVPSGVVGRFDFAGRPDLMASFPFAHAVEYRVELSDNALALSIAVQAGAGPVPVAHGLHPYLTLPGVPREAWTVELPAREHLTLDARGLPAGPSEREPAWTGALGTRTFDDAYDGLAPGAAWVLEGGGRRITTTFDTGYPAAQVFAPADDAVICFEPMAAPTNALVTGRSLRVVPAGGTDLARVTIAVTTR